MSKFWIHGPALCAAALVSASAHAAPSPQDDDVEVTADPTPKRPAPTPTPASPAPASAAEVQALREEIAAMRAEAAKTKEPPAKDVPASDERKTAQPGIPLGNGLSFTGYLQGQYESHQDSQDDLQQGGVLLNQDRFLVRRARLRLNGDWQYAAAMVEIDGNTTRGPSLSLWHAEATLHYRPDPKKMAIAAATLGLFDVPFGYELVESPRTRPFMERSQASRAFWPSEPDLGVRFGGGLGFARWSIAAVNGHSFADKQYPGQDPIGAKDVLFHFGADVKPSTDVQISGGVSALRGRGFHAGTDASKGSIAWNDQNGDGIVQPYELNGLPAVSATPSQTFEHWAVGADLQAQFWSPLGRTKVYGELLLGQNMDRGLFVADPVLSSIDARELGWYAAFTQDVTRYALVGFRYDVYDPNADATDRRVGKLLPANQKIQTFSPIFGVVLPDRAKLVFEYDVIRDHLARNVLGVPTNLKNNAWTLRLQVDL